jgi:protein ImuB
VFAALSASSLPAAALLDVARAFTPRFESLGSVVLLDASGLSRLFGSTQELGEHLRDALLRHGPGDTPRVAVAATQTAATLLALGRPGLTVVMPGKEAIALAPLGVSVLDAFEHLAPGTGHPAPGTPHEAPGTRHQAPSTTGWHHPRSTHQASRGRARVPDNRLLEILSKWGIRTLGALAALPGPEIHERLGARGAAWQALARGVDPRPLVPWVDEVPFEAAIELEWPIEGLEPLSFVLARLLEPLADRLEHADRGAAAIYTSLRLTSRTVFTRTLPLPAPMRDPKTLRTLILLDLESHPPDAPIDSVRVCLEPTPARVLQWTLLERAQPAPEQVSTLIARLTALMGEGRVGSPALVDTWKPGVFAMSDFGSRIGDQPWNADGGMGSQVPNRHSAIHPQSEISNPKSALRRFRLPIPARVTVSEGRPVRVQIDRHGYTSGAVTQAAGPWRTSGHWWAADERAADERAADERAADERRLGADPSVPSAALGSSASSAALGSSASSAALGSSASSAAWDRDEWDVVLADGTVYRLAVERGVGQWCVEGLID